MPKTIHALGLFSLMIYIFFGCKKTDPIYPFEQEILSGEGLSYIEDSLIASLPSKVFGPSEILLDNGETIEQFLLRTDPSALVNWGHRSTTINQLLSTEDAKREFISKLFSEASRIASDVTPHDKLLDTTITSVSFILLIKRPEQTGLGYAYNPNKNLTVRKQAGTCPLWIYGIDCGGYVSYMLRNAGVNIGLGLLSADGMSKFENLNNLIANSPSLKDFEYVFDDKEKIPADQIQAGDIIYFRRSPSSEVFHNGIALVNPIDKKVWIYQSNGSQSDKLNDKKKNCFQFSKADGRGPHAVKLTAEKIDDITIFNWGPDFFQNYGVLRLEKKWKDDLEGTSWRYASENNTLISGTGEVIPIIKGRPNEGIGIQFKSNNNFTITDNTDTNSGKYYTTRNSGVIKFVGGDMYGKAEIRARILRRTTNQITLQFIIYHDGYTQQTTITFSS